MTGNRQAREVACFCLVAIMLVSGCNDRNAVGPVAQPGLPDGLAQPAKVGKVDPVPASTKFPLTMAAPFADNAVLQRQTPVPVWGWASTGDTITVSFAAQTKTATADGSGKWMLSLDPAEANAKPQEMIIADSTGTTITLKNILVGEVWMASGQSNMQWIASKCNVGRVLMKQIAERVAAGREKPPVIREGKVTNVFSALHPIEHAEGEWSTRAGDFSAIAYAFAYELHRELGVPIGIVNCAFSTTSIEAWIPRVGFRDGTDEHTRSVYKRVLETDPATPEHRAAWTGFYRDIENTLKENEERITDGREHERQP
jgi:sialate O-acetylesterase